VVDARKVPTTYLTKFLKMMLYLGLPWSYEFLLTMAWGRGFELFYWMEQEGVKPNTITYMSVLKVCGIANGLELAGEKHAHTSRKLGLYGPSWEQWSLFAQKCFEIKAKKPEK
jgi:hypothetical protein